MFKRSFLLLAAILATTSFVLATASVSAVAPTDPLFGKTCTGDGANSSVCQAVDAQQAVTTDPVAHVISTAAKVIGTLTGITGVIMVVVGGLMYASAAGDPARGAKAKSTILYAVIGIVVGVLSWTLVTYLVDKLL